MTEKWPGPPYEIRAEFHAPMRFVFRWCTDYTPKDARYESETYARRILQRSAHKVVFEDLEDTKGGWFWSRHSVRLSPPNRWHSDSVGSHRAYSLDYRLSELPGGRTQLTLRARRRPYGVGGKNPPKLKWERSVTDSWKRLGQALEKDFRKSKKSPRKR